MTKFNRFFIFLSFTGLFMAYSSAIHAYDLPQQQSYQNEYGGNMSYTPITPTCGPTQNQSYGRKIGKKALSGWTNLSLGWLEMPKNIINSMNQGNFFFGMVYGGAKGLVNTVGRMGVGVADLLTFPLPTKPIACPLFIWDDFDVDTSYGEVFRLNRTQKTDQPVTQTPVTLLAPTPVATPPKAAVVDRSNQYNQEETNRKLDTVFKQEMQK